MIIGREFLAERTVLGFAFVLVLEMIGLEELVLNTCVVITY